MASEEDYKLAYDKIVSNKKSMLVARAKIRAKKKNLEFDLTKEDIEIPEYCPVLGHKLSFLNDTSYKDDSPSLDRLDNNKGYIKDNVRVISWKANFLKSHSSIDELEAIINYIKKENNN